MRRLLAPALACLALTVSGLAIAATPAYAEGEPVISAIDVSTPGHARGTVTSGTPFVAVTLRANDHSSDLGWSLIPTAAGSAAFDFETWGLTSVIVTASACTTDQPGSCGSLVLSPSATPLDVTPEVTWPEDTTIGAGPPYAVTLSDPDGGGTLVAYWNPADDYTIEGTVLEKPGPTTLPLDEEGTGEITVRRCSELWPSDAFCRATGVIRQVTVNRRLSASASLPQPDYNPISPAIGTLLEPVIKVDEPGPFTLDWHVVPDYSGSDPVDGVGGQLTGLMPDAGGYLHLSLDVAGLDDGNYNLVSTLSSDTTDFGALTGAVFGQTNFTVDVTAPTIGSITRSRSAVYPAKDGYGDTVTVSVKLSGVYNDEQELIKLAVVSDHTGNTVRTLNPFEIGGLGSRFRWDGRNSSGGSVPTGAYTLKATATDLAQNQTVVTSKVSVIRKKLASRVFRRTVSAAESLEDTYVGSCSTLRRASLRGWAGSLGYYTNTKCRRTFQNSLVVSVHDLRTPLAAVKYGGFRVAAYGGAAKAAPRSNAFLSYASRSWGWAADTRISASLATHAGMTVRGSQYVFDDKYVVWRAYTNQGAKYDVKNFTVRLAYFILVPE